MEGRATSLSETLTLPQNPTVGTVDYVPLGGDGFQAPFAAYSVRDFEQTGDAGGGTITFSIDVDERFCSYVSWLSFIGRLATVADAEYRVFSSADRHAQASEVKNARASSVLGSNEVSEVWRPPGVILPGSGSNASFGLIIENILNDVWRVSAHIYLFNVRVRELTPMGPLLWARGSV